MQALTAPPRTALTAAQVLALIHADDLAVRTGVELLDRATDTPVTDITADVDSTGATITWTGSDDISRQCALTLTRDLAWDSDRVRIYRDAESKLLGVRARFYRGVFVLSRPDDTADDTTFIPSGFTDVADDGTTATSYGAARARKVTGWDKLTLLRTKIGASWQTAWTPTGAATTLLAEVTRLLAASRWTGTVALDPTAATTLLPAPLTWPYDAQGGATFLRVLIDLHTAAGFEKPWTDEVGALRARPLTAAATQGPEWTLNADDPLTTILGPQRVRTLDVAAVPNSWRYVASAWPRTTAEGDGEITLPANTSTGPASIAARGGTVWNDDVAVDGVATQTALAAVAAARRERDLRALAVRKLTVGPLPVMGHLDIYQVIDAVHGPPTLAVARTYTETLDAGTLTSLTVEELP